MLRKNYERAVVATATLGVAAGFLIGRATQTAPAPTGCPAYGSKLGHVNTLASDILRIGFHDFSEDTNVQREQSVIPATPTTLAIKTETVSVRGLATSSTGRVTMRIPKNASGHENPCVGLLMSVEVISRTTAGEVTDMNFTPDSPARQWHLTETKHAAGGTPEVELYGSVQNEQAFDARADEAAATLAKAMTGEPSLLGAANNLMHLEDQSLAG